MRKYSSGHKKLKKINTILKSTDNLLALTEFEDGIKKIEQVLFDLRFKKATRQPFKPHEIKAAKKKRARLKTLYWQLKING